ncbi:hypothetical protein [Amycolatopsis sp. NPDC052450]|uniref:hypothetical protein n=1 Tax=Amycolatopsis sp. NPDC052450 TaxID=3363937 RepID=UPI0037C5D5D9
MLWRLTACAVIIAAVAGGCGVFGGGKHEVGECVRTTVGVGGTDIKSAECPTSGNVMDNLGDPIYKITHVVGYEESCPEDNKYGIQLKHEPDDAVYCLAIAR